MSAAPSPLYREPRSVRPPFAVRDDRFDHLKGTDPEAWRRAVQLYRVGALLEPLAGLEVSEREYAIVEWAGWVGRPDCRADRSTAARGARSLAACTAAAAVTGIRAQVPETVAVLPYSRPGGSARRSRRGGTSLRTDSSRLSRRG